MKFEIDPLPWDVGALDPYITAHTVDVHYNRHHRGYLEKLKKAIGDKPLADESLEEIVRSTQGSVFNWAAQVWNHGFFWKCLGPSGGGDPSSGPLRDDIDASFGSVDEFREHFAKAAQDEFGSGWAWLVFHGPSSKLQILSTTDAENPLTQPGLVPLLTVDVWEHAYYLDYENERGKYVEAILRHLLDWDFAAANLERARRGMKEQAKKNHPSLEQHA